MTATPTTCTYAQEIQNFANWFQYYRTREYAAKAGMGKVIAQVQDVRVGYLTTSNPTSEDIREMNNLYTEGNKKLLLDNIYSVESRSQGSPQRQLLDRAGAVFSCQGGFQPCPRLPEPAGFCQQNFALLLTDGYWSQGYRCVEQCGRQYREPVRWRPLRRCLFLDARGYRHVLVQDRHLAERFQRPGTHRPPRSARRARRHLRRR
jgi:hypothetical protein